MGDMGEIFNDMRAHKKAVKAKFGVACPQCPANRCATILLPGQRCKVDGYRDPRPWLTNEDRNSATIKDNSHGK